MHNNSGNAKKGARRSLACALIYDTLLCVAMFFYYSSFWCAPFFFPLLLFHFRFTEEIEREKAIEVHLVFFSSSHIKRYIEMLYDVEHSFSLHSCCFHSIFTVSHLCFLKLNFISSESVVYCSKIFLYEITFALIHH